MATSYANFNGTGDRTMGLLSAGGNMGFAAGNLERMIDGNTASNNCFWFSGSLIVFDFGDRVVIDEFKFYQSGGTSHGTWQGAGSNDNSSYTNIGSAGSLGDAVLATQTNTTWSGNTTAYRYYRLSQTSGAVSGGPFIYQFEFKISDGNTDNGSTSLGTFYTTTYGHGDRTGNITVTTDLSLSQGSISNLVNAGDMRAIGSTNAILLASGQSSKQITFDFGVGNSALVTQTKMNFGGADNHGTWKWRGSPDNSTWTDIGSSFTLGAQSDAWTQHISQNIDLSSNGTAYRYYQLFQVSGTTSAAQFFAEVMFATKTVTTDTGTGDLEFGVVSIAGTGTGSSAPSATGDLEFGAPSIDGIAARTETATGDLEFGVIEFQASVSVIHVTGTADLEFGNMTLAAVGTIPGAAGSGLRQFWTF